MSQISKALKKVQDLRKTSSPTPSATPPPAARAQVQEPVPEPVAAAPIAPTSQKTDIVYQTPAPQTQPANSMVLLSVCTGISILIGALAIVLAMKNLDTRQIQVFAMERTVKTQQKRINELINSINKNNTLTSAQIRDLRMRLNSETDDIDVQINSLNAKTKDNYDSLKEAILNDQQEIDLLDKNAKTLTQKINDLSASSNQLKDVPSPIIGN